MWTAPLPTPDRPTVTEKVEFRMEDDESLGAIRAELTLTSFEAREEFPPRKLKLEATIDFSVKGECSRCVARIEKAVSTSFETLIDLREGTTTAMDLETPPEPGGFRKVGDREIDVSDELHQRIYLAVPSVLLCKADCRGLCPQCGTNWNKAKCECRPRQGSGHFDGLKKLL